MDKTFSQVFHRVTCTVAGFPLSAHNFLFMQSVYLIQSVEFLTIRLPHSGENVSRFLGFAYPLIGTISEVI